MNGTPGPGEVDLTPFREIFDRSGMRVHEVARAGGLEWSQTARLLGRQKAPASVKKGKRYGPYWCSTCTYETAVKLARAMDVDPWEVGL